MLENNDKAIELLFGGAKYGGKSWFGVNACYGEAIRLIETFDIKRSDYPLPIGFLGRKVAKTFYETTFETWKKAIPSKAYRLKGNPPVIIIADRVKYYTGGLDRTEIVKEFNSAEFAMFFIDQAEETAKDDISLLRTATFWRLSINGIKIPGKGLYTANPGKCWLKSEFIDIAA